MIMVRKFSLFSSGLSWRVPIGAMLLAGVSACASVSAPAGPQPVVQNRLQVCAGAHVSNAPVVNKAGFMKNFRPVHTVRGQKLHTLPVPGCLSSGFGKRHARGNHKGIDLFTRRPILVTAAGAGRVSFIGRQRGYGRLVEIAHGNGVSTRYAHLSGFHPGLKVGTRVSAATPLGKTGASGNATAIHLHYEILINGKQKNPLAP